MKQLVVSLTALFPALGIIGSVTVISEDDEAVITRVLTDYYRAFSTLDVQAILPYCHEPTFIVSSQGVAAVPTHAALMAAIAPGMEAFRARAVETARRGRRPPMTSGKVCIVRCRFVFLLAILARHFGTRGWRYATVPQS
jgi:hypothetical protein